MVIGEALLTTTLMIYKHKDRPSEPTLTVPKKDVSLVLPYLGFHSGAITAHRL